MAHQLQLADNGNNSQMKPSEILEYMLQIPTEDGGFVWVREDQLDHLPDETFDLILRQQQHLSDSFFLAGAGRDRRIARRQLRKSERRAAGETRREGRREFFTGLVGKVGDIFGRGGNGNGNGGRGLTLPQFTGGLNIGVAKWWQNPAVILLGLTIVVVGGVAYVRAQKKKK